MMTGALLSVASWFPRAKLAPPIRGTLETATTYAMFAASVITVAAGSYSPFLYFQF